MNLSLYILNPSLPLVFLFFLPLGLQTKLVFFLNQTFFFFFCFSFFSSFFFYLKRASAHLEYKLSICSTRSHVQRASFFFFPFSICSFLSLSFSLFLFDVSFSLFFLCLSFSLPFCILPFFLFYIYSLPDEH